MQMQVRTRLKRAIDIFVAAAGIVFVSVPMLLIAALIKLTSGGPILIRQVRPGVGGRPFRLIKFRTMEETRDLEGNLLSDEQRLTRLGRFLRRTSLDELPELINVLKGEMSSVGPRPLLMQYLDRYTPEQARRHEVRPGITGWAQINGRNALTWEEKFKLDVWYVDHRSLALDLKILLLTPFRVLRGYGISAKGHVTMPEFMGTQTGKE